FPFALVALDVAVNLDEISRAGTGVQAIHILSDEREAFDRSLERGERIVPRVRFRSRHELAPPRVPLPHGVRIAREGFWRGEIFRTEARPQSGECIAESRNAGLGRDPGAGENGDTARSGEERARPREGLHGIRLDFASLCARPSADLSPSSASRPPQ